MDKEKLIKLIASELCNSEEAFGEINAIATENEYEDVAEMIVNKITSHLKLPKKFNPSKFQFPKDQRVVYCSIRLQPSKEYVDDGLETTLAFYSQGSRSFYSKEFEHHKFDVLEWYYLPVF